MIAGFCFVIVAFLAIRDVSTGYRLGLHLNKAYQKKFIALVSLYLILEHLALDDEPFFSIAAAIIACLLYIISGREFESIPVPSIKDLIADDDNV